MIIPRILFFLMLLTLVFSLLTRIVQFLRRLIAKYQLDLVVVFDGKNRPPLKQASFDRREKAQKALEKVHKIREFIYVNIIVKKLSPFFFLVFYSSLKVLSVNFRMLK